MKKLMAILCVFLLLFTLTACSSENDVKKVKTSGDAQEAIVDVSNQIEDVSSTLDSLNKDLG